MKKLLSFLFGYSPFLVFSALVLSMITGLSNAGLIALLHRAIEQFGDPDRMLVAEFIGLGIALPLSSVVSAMLLAYLSQKSVYDLRMHLSRQIVASPLRRTEALGAHQLLTSLTSDISTITNMLTNLPFLVRHVTIIVCCIAYLAWIYWPAAIGVVVTAGIGVGIFQFFAGKAYGYLTFARKDQDDMFKHFEALTRGTKELKLHRPRREVFFGELFHLTASTFRRNNLIASGYFAVAGGMGAVTYFTALGILMFVLPIMNPSITVNALVGFNFVLLFLMPSLDALTGLIPGLNSAVVALRKVESLGVSLEKVTLEKQDTPDPDPNWRQISLNNVTHTYHREKEDMVFKMGPINLEFKPGELTFIVGGNGSGKTTLAKIILGLYAPESGEVVLNGTEINDNNRETYRQLFSAVFVDFYLFESMVGLDKNKVSDEVARYLSTLQLQHKVTITDNQLSTLDLSQGQRKRLALLTAYLEDRPIYLFDEWAADQDPTFKEIFYHVLLPELKAKGKTVLVISHDDHYYHIADRIIKIDYGQIEYNRRITQV